MSGGALHIPAGTKPEIAFLGIRMRILAEGGAASLFEERTPAGVGPPLHLHEDADEFFRVLAGRYRFRVGEASLEAGPGDTLRVPRGLAHCFWNAGPEEGRLFIGLAPGGGEGFFAELAASGLAPERDGPAIAAMAVRWGIRLLGPNPFADG